MGEIIPESTGSHEFEINPVGNIFSLKVDAVKLSGFLCSLSWIDRHYEQTTDPGGSDIYSSCNCFQNEGQHGRAPFVGLNARHSKHEQYFRMRRPNSCEL